MPHTDKTYYAYLVCCADDTLYAGYAVDLEERIRKHNSGKGAKYTATRRPVRLVYSAQFASRSEAMKHEAWLKRQPRRKKLELINDARNVE